MRFLILLFFWGDLARVLADSIVLREMGMGLLVSNTLNIIINIIYNFNESSEDLTLYASASAAVSESSEIT
jgi:hypothetical protein